MKRSITQAVGLFLALAVAGCGSKVAKYEALVDETFTVYTDLADALESVKDDASATAAAKKIHSAFDHLEEIGKKAHALPKLSQSDTEMLEKKYRSDLKKLSKRVESAGFQAGKYAGKNKDLLNAIKRQETVDMFPFPF